VSVRALDLEEAGVVRPQPIRRLARRWPLLIACILVVVPFAILATRLLRSHWFTTGDVALTELRVRDIGGSHTPLVGQWSRYGWNHPGPLLFYMLAIPYRALGSTSGALLGGSAIINGAAVVGCAVLLWRRGRVMGLLLGLVVTLIVVHALGGSFLGTPWNPFMTVLPMLALVLVVWSVANGDHWMLPIAVALGSFVVQSHVGVAGIAFALVGIATAAVIFDARRGRARGYKKDFAWSAALGAFLWWPPILEQFQSDGGNLSSLWSFWTSRHPTPGFVDGARIVAPQLSLPAPWISGHEHVAAFTGGLDPPWTVPFVLVVLLAATWFAWRRRDRESFTLDVIALTLIVVAWFSAASVVDVPLWYLMRWTWLVGAVAWLAIGWTVLRAAGDQSAPAVRLAVGAGTGATIVALVIASAVSAVDAVHLDPLAERETRALEATVVAALPESTQPVLLTNTPGFLTGSVEAALLIRLARAGVVAGLSTDQQRVVGDGHVLPRRKARTLLVIVADERIPVYARDPRYRTIASYDQLSPPERAYVDEKERVLGALDSTARFYWASAHRSEADRLQELRARGGRMAVFTASPDAADHPPPGG
jgi:hypothetical protein